MDPIVNIVIPTYNREHFLVTCLDSLTKQTFQNFKVTICDDGSTDNTSNVVNTFTNLLFIDYIYIPNSGSPALPRNHGILNTNEEYIAFLDSDDWWLPEKLEVSIKVLGNGYDIVYHDLLLYNDSIKTTDFVKTRQLTESSYVDLLYNGNAINCSSVVCRTKALQRCGFFSEDPNCRAS